MSLKYVYIESQVTVHDVKPGFLWIFRKRWVLDGKLRYFCVSVPWLLYKKIQYIKDYIHSFIVYRLNI